MTAEIAVMNNQAVALAADSAATVNYPDGQKIYNSVNKLFRLSQCAPVGIMIYGTAELTGIPWETIIKSFRRELGNKPLSHLQDYADRFIDYINDHKLMFTEGNQRRQLIASTLHEYIKILHEFEEKCDAVISENGEIPDSRIRRIITSAIRDHHAKWKNADRLLSAPDDFEKLLQDKWSNEISVSIKSVFGKLPISATSKKRLIEIACLVWTKDQFPPSMSGVVIAGFGEEEYTPSLIAYDVAGVVCNFVKARARTEEPTAIGADSSAAIVPFAQGEMVYQFMEGIDQRVEQLITHALNGYTEELIRRICDPAKIPSRRASVLRKLIVEEAGELAEDFFSLLEAYRNEYHVKPITTAVAHLPKEELAAMAESLVSLTSFKRRVTHAPETVGGPIDVAVISKGDGFIWIKRKHYFDPALNHHFFANYNQD